MSPPCTSGPTAPGRRRRHRPARPRGRRRRGPGRRPGRARRRRARRDRAVPRGGGGALAATPTPAYGISTGFGALATRHIPTDLRAQLQRSLVRSHAAGSRPRGRARGGAGADAAAALDAGDRPHRRPARRPCRRCAGMLNARHHAGGPRVRLARLLRRPRAAVALRARADGRGRGARRRTATTMPAADALAAAGLAPVELAAKEGLALINGTDGMLGMLVLAIADLRMLLARRRHRRRDVASRACSAPTASSPPTCRRCGRTRARPRRRPTCARLLAGLRRSSPSPPRARLQPRPGRLLAALLAPGARRGPRHRRARGAWSPAASWPRAVDNPVVLDDGRVESNGNFHGAPVGLRARLPRDRRRRRGLDQRAAHRPVPRQGPQPRAAAVPGRRPRRRQRAHDRAVHPGRDRLGAEAARRARPASTRSRRSAMQEDHVSMGWSAARKLRRARRRADPGRRHRGAHRRPRARPARPAAARRRPPAPSVALLRRRPVRGPRPRPAPRPGDRAPPSS